MRTIGQTIKDARVKKKLSLESLERQTKIKKEFIDALEKSRWEKLPELPVVTGFVKNIAPALKLSKRNLVALLRRDYPPKKLSINPKPDVFRKFTWSPKLTFLTGMVVIILTIASYLFFQYRDFMSPPELVVDLPIEEQVVDADLLTVSGKVDPEATVSVNNQQVIVGEEGEFSTEIEIIEDTREVVVKAVSRSGKESMVVRSIIPKLGK